MKKLQYILYSMAVMLLTASCTQETYEFGELTAPSEVTIVTDVVGKTAAKPFGDGSGKVNFTATGKNVITYKYVINDSKSITSANGLANFTYEALGTNKYVVTLVAYGAGGVSTTKTVEIEIFVAYTPPADLLTMLNANSTRTWKIKAQGIGHFGVGPAGTFNSDWWSASANDKAAWECYDDRFVFKANGDFQHITNGKTFGKLAAMAADLGGDQGLTPNGDGEAIFALPDYTEKWSLSAPGGQETLSFSNKGYHGFYVGGNHKYSILSRSDNEMKLRTIGADGNAWYVILIAE
jgi:PKD repeat protein